MAFTLDTIVPWGRSFEEYRAMFALTAGDLERRILGCGDGPAAFNADATRHGGRVVSIDPLYRYSAAEIRKRIEATRDKVLDETRRNRHGFVWTRFRNVEALGRARMAAMTRFLEDYPGAAGRYLPGALPALPFRDGAFDLALCSHLLFLYSEQLSATWHHRSIRNLARVAREVRVFPLVELGGRPSRHLDAVTARLTSDGFRCEVVAVDYEFQRGANAMLRVRPPDP